MVLVLSVTVMVSATVSVMVDFTMGVDNAVTLRDGTITVA